MKKSKIDVAIDKINSLLRIREIKKNAILITDLKDIKLLIEKYLSAYEQSQSDEALIREKRTTAITEFEIIAPTNELETIGEKLTLSMFGEYCPKKSLRGYSLLELLDHPAHYRVSKITMKGQLYVIPADREKNWIHKYKIQQ